MRPAREPGGGQPAEKEVTVKHSIPSVLSALILTFGPAPATAQVGSAEGAPARTAELPSINGRDEIRVLTRSGWVELYGPQLRLDSIVYAAAKIDPTRASELGLPLPLDRITEIQVRGSKAGTGALIGGVTSAGLNLAVMTSVCSDSFWECDSGEIAAATLLSFAGGALWGALIGGRMKTWKTVYRKP